MKNFVSNFRLFEKNFLRSKVVRLLVTFAKVDVDIEALEAKKHKDLDEALAITDVDPRYFSELDARLVREKFSVRKYVEDSREILKCRLLAGQQMDDCIRIDQQFVEEQKRLDRIKVCSKFKIRNSPCLSPLPFHSHAFVQSIFFPIPATISSLHKRFRGISLEGSRGEYEKSTTR